MDPSREWCSLNERVKPIVGRLSITSFRRRSHRNGSLVEESATTREISRNVAQASAGIEAVNESVVRSSAAAGEISTEISDVNHSAVEMVASSSQILASARNLNDLAGQLKGMAGRFRV